MIETTHWTHYWASGNLTSLPEDFRNNYDEEIADFWWSVFSSAPEQSHILDICSGNGAIAILAAEYALKNNKAFTISAVDAAEINIDTIKKSYQGFERFESFLSFKGGVQVETLEIPSESYDVITSQYGFEYCDLEEATKSVYRLLKIKGIFALITHTTNSDMLQVMQQEQIEYQTLEKYGFFQLFNDIKDDQKRSLNLLQKISELNSDLGGVRDINPSGIIASIKTSFGGLLESSLESFENYIDDIEKYILEVHLGYRRLEDFLYVHIKLNQADHWTTYLQANKFKLIRTGDIIYHRKHNAGTYYVFEKVSH